MSYVSFDHRNKNTPLFPLRRIRVDSREEERETQFSGQMNHLGICSNCLLLFLLFLFFSRRTIADRRKRTRKRKKGQQSQQTFSSLFSRFESISKRSERSFIFKLDNSRCEERRTGRTNALLFDTKTMLVRLLFIIKLLLLLLLLSNNISPQIISSRQFSSSIEKIFLRDDRIFIGTTNFLHQISSLTLNESQLALILGPVHQNDFHWKILQSIDKETFLVCGTSFQGVCSLIDENFNFIVNSSIPVVANDRENSSIALVLNEKNLIYFGVTFTSDGVFRWQIPSIAGRSLNRTRFMRIVSSASNDDEFLSKEDLAVRFMPRQQTSFIVQYVFAFQTENFLYFLTRQPNEFEGKSLTTKIVRFCRENSNSILRSYAELPLSCVNSDWILSSAEIFNDEILVGLFTRKDRREGSTFCSWKIRHDIDRAFQETYRQCYSMGIGQRGLTFIKPNEICRRDDVS